MKRLKIIVVGIMVLIVVAVGVVLLKLDGIVRSTVESQASSSLNLKTTLDAAHVSLLGQSLALDDLQIGSPSGFSSPKMMSFDKAAVHVSVGQLREDPIHIKQITIDSPTIVLELNGTKLNFQAMMDQPSKTPTDPKSGQAAQPMKVIIDELTVTNPKVSLLPGSQFAQLGVKDMSLTLPSITLNNIGTGDGSQNGAAIKDVLAQLFAEIASKAGDSDQLPPELKNLLHLNAQQLVSQIGKQLQGQLGKQLDKVGGDLGKNVGDALKSNDAGKAVEKSIGDVLGGKKKDKKGTTKP